MTERDQNNQRDLPEKFQAGFDTYLSVFTYRYGTPEMRKIWSQERFWTGVRDVWIATAETQQEARLTKKEQVDDLKKNRDDISVERIFQLENQVTRHDVASAGMEFSEVAPIGGEILGQGETSEDTLSNTEIVQVHESLNLIRPKVVSTLEAFGERIDENKDLVCMGWTHLQAAEPTTMGYRFAKYAQDLVDDLELLDKIKPMIKGKGIKGAVGTSATFKDILEGTGMTVEEHEQKIMEKLGIESVTISDQTYPRKKLLLTEFIVSSIGQSLHRFALDIQVLQSSAIDEVSEPRGRDTIGSFAMPHKQNPINTESIDALTEELPGELFSSWMTSAFVTLERTLRDSAGKRSWLPESFLIIDEALARAERVIRGMTIHENSVKTNLDKFAPFSASEIILEHLVKGGMDRKVGHELLRGHAQEALEAKRSGLPNPMKELVSSDERITSVIGKDKTEKAFEDIFAHVGIAPELCTKFLQEDLYPAIEKG